MRTKIYESPIRLLTLIALTIFITHTVAMGLFGLLPRHEMWVHSAIQSSILLLLLFPVLYYFAFRPLVLHIRERDEAEASMRESEYKYRNLFEHLSDAAFLVDVETGRILDTNSQGERLLERTRGEIMGLNQSKLYAANKESEARARFATYARQERPEDYNTEIIRKNAENVPVRISGIPTILHGRRLILEFVRDLRGHAIEEVLQDNQLQRKELQ